MAIENLEDLIEISDEEVKDFGIDTSLLSETIEDDDDKDDDSKTKKKTSKKNTQYSKEEQLEIDDEDENDDKDDNKDSDDSKETFTNDDDDDKKDKDEPGNLFGEFSNELRTGGLFPNLTDDDFEGVESLEDIGNLINKQSSANLMSWKNDYVQNMVTNLINDGIISQDQAKEYSESTYTKDDFDNETIAKEVIREYHLAKELPKDMSDKIIDNEVDLKEAAIQAHDYLNKYKEKRNAELAKRTQERDAYTAQEREQFQTKLKEEVYAYDEFIPGSKLTAKDKLEVLNSIPGVMDKVNKNFTHYAPILAYLDKHNILDLNFEKLIAKGETKGTNKMEEILKNKKKKGSDGSTRKTEDSFKIDDSDLKRTYRL